MKAIHFLTFVASAIGVAGHAFDPTDFGGFGEKSKVGLPIYARPNYQNLSFNSHNRLFLIGVESDPL